MSVSIGIHLGAEVRVTAPERADAYLDIVHDGTAISLFLGQDDQERIEVIDRIAEALLEVRVRCMAHLVTIDAEPDLTESEARPMDGNR